MAEAENAKRSMKVRVAKGAAKLGFRAGKEGLKATGKVLGGTKKGMGTAGRKTLGPDKYRRQVDDVNMRLSDSLQKLEAVLKRQQQRISDLEAELARERGADK